MTRREGRSRKRPKMSPECRRNTGRPEPLKASNLAPMLSTTASTAASALLAQQDQAHRKQANPVTSIRNGQSPSLRNQSRTDLAYLSQKNAR
ncbi:hypothetical protein IWW34DRAFT_735884 [Fusarium oxysporum f. sp. albedinis]|nr:hypothetical protein IWW34DRAFT_735884 [Fusarium oxysporum f. sp. albedinis]